MIVPVATGHDARMRVCAHGDKQASAGCFVVEKQQHMLLPVAQHIMETAHSCSYACMRTRRQAKVPSCVVVEERQHMLLQDIYAAHHGDCAYVGYGVVQQDTRCVNQCTARAVHGAGGAPRQAQVLSAGMGMAARPFLPAACWTPVSVCVSVC